MNLKFFQSTLKSLRTIWPNIGRVWITLGVMALFGIVGWSLGAYRASDEARHALLSDDQVAVIRSDGYWSFIPHAGSSPRTVGLVFFAGALVEPAAYAPLAGAVARRGFPTLLVELPRRGAFGGADGPEVIERARAAMRKLPDVTRWIIAGHSRGGAVAARFVRESTSAVAALVLVATSHPRDFSLA